MFLLLMCRTLSYQIRCYMLVNSEDNFIRFAVNIPYTAQLVTPVVAARSEACPLGMQAAPSSILTSGTFFHGDLVMKKFLQPFSLFR